MKDKAKFYFKCNSFLLFIMHLPGGGLKGGRAAKRQEIISIDLGFPFLLSHSRRDGLFKITKLVCDPLSGPLANYFLLPVMYEGSILVSYKGKRSGCECIEVLWMKK